VKIGRNKPCWCGSEKKYKRCHLNRDTQNPVNQGEIHKQLNSFYAKKTCSVPISLKHECSKKIIKAHSISKSSSLKEIAEDGHVLTTFKSASMSGSNFTIKPKRIGINQASTFTGFCSH
jgi:membrane-bound inhibitor of C-type lysozyme